MIEGSTTLPSKDIHSEAFKKLAASLATEHPYGMPADPHADGLTDDSDADSSRSSSKGNPQPPLKCKAKTHHTSATTQAKLLTFEPGEIIHPRSTAMLTYLMKLTKDTKKGIDRAWKSCQDKLLDLSGPLTKILELAYHAKESNTPVDTETLIGWSQRAICMLGNTNCAISNERAVLS
ncbi:hypothetical protein NDU88_000455 [Pleurodeles waltl]|uniref:Uncharacterized protein n=1 Tax=Pleurodeles waltl TaxID=8319 RepID=A0AAV7S4M6_PLEWA|nr:hypothetical protein NDU88_000455 [Pleurodeles waltl]